MTAKERILVIRLLQKGEQHPEWMKRLTFAEQNSWEKRREKS